MTSQRLPTTFGTMDYFLSCVKIINILEDFLRNRKQRVVLDGQCSSRVDIRAGVPKRSILGPLLFLIYIKDNRSKRTVLFRLTIILSWKVIEKERKILRVSTNTVITHNYLIVFIAHKVIKLITWYCNLLLNYVLSHCQQLQLEQFLRTDNPLPNSYLC